MTFFTLLSLGVCADNNTVSCADHSLENVINKLIKDSLSLIQWFLNNKVKADLEKFQVIAVGQQKNI